MKKCPFCAESIQEEAIKCKHCGELLTASTASLSARTGGRPLSKIEEKPPTNVLPELSKTPLASTSFVLHAVKSIRVWVGILLIMFAVNESYDALFVSKNEKDRDLQNSATELARHDDAQSRTDFYTNYDRAGKSTEERLLTSFVAVLAGFGLLIWGIRATQKKAAAK